MADQIVITEKTSQAKDVRAAVGSRYGDILPAEGHLLDLLEPEDVVPAWKRWCPILLRPEGLYGTRPAEGGNKAAKLKAIREALRTARRVWHATDCDREGQLIGQEILEHYSYRGQVMRVLFTAQDSQTIRDAFGRAKPNAEYAPLYAAAVARRQADQIYNLSLTRTATVILGRGARGVIGVGRVKTPTLAIVCRRELEIRNFVPQAYFEVVATATVARGQFQMRHAPQERIVRREVAQAVVEAAQGFEGTLGVRVEDKRQGPPKLHDLPSLQKLCSSRFGWPASKTLEVAQELYDGQGKKIITYPRAEVRYLPESLISDVPKIVAGLQAGKSFSAIPVPDPPIIRKGASGSFHDKGLAGTSHHAVIPNVNTVDNLREVWPRLSIDERKMFDVIARAYLAAVMPDFRYRQTTATLDVRGFPFRATGRQPIDLGWRAAFPEWQPADEKGDEAQLLPALRNGETTKLENPTIEDKETRPPPRYTEGTLIEAMQNAWRFVDDEVLRERLKEAKGIGTPATRAEIIGGLKKQAFLIAQGKNIVPTETGLALFGVAPTLAQSAILRPKLWERVRMMNDPRQYAPATPRNRDFILGVLRDVLPTKGVILEIASGSGEHVVHFARNLPSLVFQPSDREPDALQSVAAWVKATRVTNVRVPLVLDVSQSPWPIASADGIICINMVHISPWDATLGLIRGAAAILPPTAPLYLYGPYKREGFATTPSNQAFDRSLRDYNPTWGLRDLEAVAAIAQSVGFSVPTVTEMPANNLSVVFHRI